MGAKQLVAKNICEVSPPFPKKGGHFFSAFLFQNTTRYDRFGVHGLWGVSGESPFLVGSAVDYRADLRPTDRTGAHHARLYRYIQAAIGQVFRT